MHILHHEGYVGFAELDSRDGLLRGYVPNCRREIAFHAATVAELTSSFRDAVDAYLDSCKAIGAHPESQPDLHITWRSRHCENCSHWGAPEDAGLVLRRCKAAIHDVQELSTWPVGRCCPADHHSGVSETRAAAAAFCESHMAVVVDGEGCHGELRTRADFACPLFALREMPYRNRERIDVPMTTDTPTDDGMESKEARHGFTLIFDGVPDLTDAVTNALYEAGCDDGTFMWTGGLLHAAFHRIAPDYDTAVAGAIADVRKANIGAIFVCVDRDDDNREEG